MSVQESIKLAQALPPRLLRFFAKYPPPQLFPNAASPTAQAAVATTITSPVDAIAPPTESAVPTEQLKALDISDSSPQEPEAPLYHNPFQPRKNFRTGKWIGPVYGLRKQADLVKLAEKHNVLDLLPYTIKKPGEKEARRIERGLRVKGTGVGQKVKGKKWERTLKGRLEERREAMLNMPALIQEWKQVCIEGVLRLEYFHTNKWIERTWTRMEEVAQMIEMRDVWTSCPLIPRNHGLHSILVSGAKSVARLCTIYQCANITNAYAGVFRNQLDPKKWESCVIRNETVLLIISETDLFTYMMLVLCCRVGFGYENGNGYPTCAIFNM